MKILLIDRFTRVISEAECAFFRIRRLVTRQILSRNIEQEKCHAVAL